MRGGWMNFIKRTAVRRVVWILVGLLVYGVASYFSEARAECRIAEPAGRFNGATYNCDYEGEARAAVNAEPIPPGHAECSVRPLPAFSEYPSRWVRQLQYPGTGTCGIHHPQVVGWTWATYVTAGCPPGSVWNEELQRCVSNEECRNRTDSQQYKNRIFSGVGGRHCVEGCVYEQRGGGCTSISGDSIPTAMCFGAFSWTGETCSNPSDGAPPADPGEDPPEQCRQVGAGGFNQTLCIDPNGDHCYTAGSGRKICWTPGETGEKGDGDTMQTRGPGTNPKPPNSPVTPSGDTLSPSGPPVTTTTTSVNGTTTTTTTQNNKTTNGTDATPGKNSGKPANSPGGNAGGGGGGGGRGDGEGDGDGDGSFSGGGDCNAPPVCSGDPVGCGLAEINWRSMCSGWGKDLSPGDADGLMDAVSALEAYGDEEPGESPWDRNEDPFAGSRGIVGSDWFLSQIDDSRFMSGSCPQLPAVSVGGVNIPFDLGPICSLLANLSYIILGLAYFLAFRIMAGT